MSPSGAGALAAVFAYFATPLVHPCPTRPWRIAVHGEPWLWATEGHFLVGIKGVSGGSDPTPEKYVLAAHYLSDPLEEARAVPWARVAAFAGDVVPRARPCDQCDGSGRSDYAEPVACEHCHQQTRPACDACGGDGVGALPIAYGRLVDRAPINLPYLAFALSLVPPCETVTIGRLAVGAVDVAACVVDGGDWRIVVMGIRAGGHEVITPFEEPASVAAVQRIPDSPDSSAREDGSSS